MAEEKQEVLNPSARNIRWFLASLGLGCFAFLVMLEIATQGGDHSLLDLLVDAASMLLTIVAAVGVALLAQRMQVQHEERIALIRDLEVARAEGNGWRAKVRSHLAGLKAGLDQQFHEWGMTAAEREVGLLILKGLSHKEIAALRATTEATVRQQAQAIYRKANLPGKTAFSAYFLEDLFAPDVAISGPSMAPSRKAQGEPWPGKTDMWAERPPNLSQAVPEGRSGPSFPRSAGSSASGTLLRTGVDHLD